MKYSAMRGISISVLPLIPLRFRPEIGNKSYPLTQFRARKRKLPSTISCSNSDNSSQSTPSPTQQQQLLNLSVLRFTFGIPGLDESYLPRWIGYAFGSLLLLNHFAGSESSAITPAQLRTEVLGLFLAAFSIIIPYLGKFLKLILIQDALCVRGYWNTPKDITKDHLHGWFEKQINKIGLSNLKETLYFPQAEDMELWEMLPIGTCSLLVQPVLHAQNISSNRTENSNGFILLASSSTYAYSNKDRAWTRAVAKKFGG